MHTPSHLSFPPCLSLPFPAPPPRSLAPSRSISMCRTCTLGASRAHQHLAAAARMGREGGTVLKPANEGGREGEHAIRRQAHTSSSASPSMRTGSKSRRPGGEHAPPTFDKSSRRSSSISTSSICAHSHSSLSDWHRATMWTRTRELARSECH